MALNDIGGINNKKLPIRVASICILVLYKGRFIMRSHGRQWIRFYNDDTMITLNIPYSQISDLRENCPKKGNQDIQIEAA